VVHHPTYARRVDSGREDPAVEAERAPRVPVHDPLPSALTADPRGGLAGTASSIGNRGFSTVVARMRAGEGISAGGLVHPDVEQAIALAHGGGRPLERSLSQRLENSGGGALDDVRVHVGPQAEQLARAVEARAFTVGSDIFFGAGEYRPGTADGDQLIAHEVAHVAQQRGAPAGGPLTVTEPGDAFEREAEAFARGSAG
jgi:Domain of unknown function (DUF4157)